jgi:hypothetical protein
MKKTVVTTHLISALLPKVWENISKSTEVNTWLPIVTTCELQGEGEGAKRICGTEQGNLYETILKIDHSQYLFQYSIDQQPLLPLTNLVGTMRLSEAEGKTQLEWTADFEVENEEAFAVIQPAIEGMYAMGAAGLERVSQN